MLLLLALLQVAEVKAQVCPGPRCPLRDDLRTVLDGRRPPPPPWRRPPWLQPVPTPPPTDPITTQPVTPQEEDCDKTRSAKAIDISHWSVHSSDYKIYQSDVDAWKNSGVEHAIVGTQREERTRQQLDLLTQNGISTDAYVWLNWDTASHGSMADQIKEALDTVDGYDIGTLWLDVEETPDGQTPSELTSLVQQAVDAFNAEAAARGLDTRVGIYSCYGFWTSSMGNTTAFKDLPLWYAHYDDDPTFSDWDGLGFGGWTDPWGKQYVGNTYLGTGTPVVDLNTVTLSDCD